MQLPSHYTSSSLGRVVQPSLGILSSRHWMNLKLTSVRLLDKRNWLMAPSLLSHDMRVFYRPELKWEPDAQFQVAWIQLISNLSDILEWQKNIMNYVTMTVTWPRYNLYSRCKMRTRFNMSGSSSTLYCLQILSDILD